MTSVDTGSCPLIEHLEMFVDGTGDGHVAEHVNSCVTCQQRVAEIHEGDAFLDLHRKALAGAIGPRVPEVLSIPGYRILAQIGAGGQGVVYKAVQTGTHRKVAVKVLRTGALANERQRFRFEREAELLASLRHPNIVTLFDRGHTPDGRDYLVMEWLHGLPFDQYVRERLNPAVPAGALRVRAQLELFSRIAGAIQHAHGGSVIHRDLKPSNILVDDAGEPHIIDFGLARPELGARGPMPTMTEDFAGTRAYASPEQVSGGSDRMRVTTDVYSLGVILYEALTGTFPYPIDGSPSEIDRHIQFTAPQPPRMLNRDIPDDVSTIVLTALRKEPRDRYAGAGAMAADIDDFLAGLPIAAKKDSAWYVIRRTLRRHRRSVATVGASLVFLVFCAAALVRNEVLSARAVAEQARALAESQRAEALSLVLQSVGRPWRPGGIEDYAAREPSRLDARYRLGWFGTNQRRESDVASLLAVVIRDCGSPASAEELLRQATVHRLLDLGPNHPDTARSMHDLAEILLVRNRLADALEYCERARSVNRKVYGESSLESARSDELLARILLAKGDARSAEQLASAALAVQCAHLGEENTELAQSLDTRSTALLDLGQRDAAETACRHALRLRLALLVDEHPDVATSLRHLAGMLESRTDDARIDALADAMEAPTFPLIAHGLRQLAGDLEHLGTPARTDALQPVDVLRRMLAVKVAVLGRSHRGLLSTLAALVVETHALGDAVGKESILAKAIPVVEETMGPGSLALANGLETWATALLELDRYGDAIAAQQRAVDIWWALPADRRDDFQAAANERVLAYYMVLDNRYEVAERCYAHCIEMLLRVRGPDNHILAIAKVQHAFSMCRLGHAEEAEREARQAIALRERLAASRLAGPPGALRYFLGSILAARGSFDEAERQLMSAWDGAEDGDALKRRLPRDPLRRLLVDDMIKICVARRDAQCEAGWRSKLGGQ